MTDLNNRAYYTKRAESARQSAGEARDEAIRSIHLGIASRYDELAATIKPELIAETDGQLHVERSFQSKSAERRNVDLYQRDTIALMVADALPQMVWSTLPDGYHDYYNSQWYEFTGMQIGSTDGDDWNGMFHPDDQERAWNRWQHCLATGNSYEIEYRLRRHDGKYRWVLGRALAVRGASGNIVRWVGTCTDIHDAYMIADQNALLTKEMNHRIANIFAVIGSLIMLEALEAPSASSLASAMHSKLAALNAAHRLVQTPSRPTGDKSQATVQTIIRAVIKPYENEAGTRFTLRGSDLNVDENAITAVALVFHELCTNAIKYGALTSVAGTVSIETIQLGSTYEMIWIERGGPIMVDAPDTEGFGTVLTKVTIEQQLGGTLHRTWTTDGLEMKMVVECVRLHGAT